MSKNKDPGVPGGNTRGDVLCIRATSQSGTNAPSSHKGSEASSPHTSQNISHQRLSQELTQQPQHTHHLSPSQRSHHQQPIPPIQQYHPEHVDHSQFMMPQMPSGPGGDVVHRMPSHTGVEGWSEKEEALSAELDEAKIRVAQMEKTMRWWSDCTSNWREKWNKARNERNKAREENRLLRGKLESLAKELSHLKRERKDKTVEKECGSNEEQISNTSSKSAEKLAGLSEKEKSVLSGSNEKETESLDDLSETSSPKSKHFEEKEVDDMETFGSVHGSQSSDMTTVTREMNDKLTQLQSELLETNVRATKAGENVLMMQRKLDEANNTIQAERLENCNCMKQIESLRNEVKELQTGLEEKHSSSSALKKEKSEEAEDELDECKELHQRELHELSLQLEDEALSGSNKEKTVTDLRRELEKLQEENANEWAKRERLETEKLGLERESKKLRAQVVDLEEQLAKKVQTTSSMADLDMKSLQFELAERSKELTELKHVHSKMKKVLVERNTELDHSKRRGEQYEGEVRKLRARIDELKHDLASAEDEMDSQSNAARKAQRTSDELQGQVDGLQVQVNHLQSRLRRSGKHNDISTPRSTSLKSLTLDDSVDFGGSGNDFDEI